MSNQTYFWLLVDFQTQFSLKLPVSFHPAAPRSIVSKCKKGNHNKTSRFDHCIGILIGRTLEKKLHKVSVLHRKFIWPKITRFVNHICFPFSKNSIIAITTGRITTFEIPNHRFRLSLFKPLEMNHDQYSILHWIPDGTKGRKIAEYWYSVFLKFKFRHYYQNKVTISSLLLLKEFSFNQSSSFLASEAKKAENEETGHSYQFCAIFKLNFHQN